ncbi:MAG: PAS domain S-box protein, partial [Myxococcales bacterium]|nr:PAS domain S-box protein [Myxococcales bacterium]
MDTISIAIRDAPEALCAAVRALGVPVDPAGRLILAARPQVGEEEATIGVAATVDEARAMLRRGLLDVVVWPDDRGRLSIVVERAAARLQERIDLARYRTAFRESATWMEMGDVDIVLTDVSRGFEDATGICRRDAVGRTPSMLFDGGLHPRPHFERLERAVAEEHVWKGDLLGRQRDGSVALLETHIGSVEVAGRPVGGFAIKREAGQRHHGAMRTWIDQRTAPPWLITDSGGRVLS